MHYAVHQWVLATLHLVGRLCMYMAAVLPVRSSTGLARAEAAHQKHQTLGATQNSGLGWRTPCFGPVPKRWSLVDGLITIHLLGRYIHVSTQLRSVGSDKQYIYRTQGLELLYVY